MKVAVGRCPETQAPLALQSTISRLENAPSKTEAGRLSAALLDQFGTTVKPGKLEVLDIDDTFCGAHGAQLALWNVHHDERGFASMHIYHVASGTPVAAILRPARTPKGSEVRTVIKHVGTSIYSDFERRGAGAACKFRFFHGVGCSSACGVRFALVFERGIREHCAVQMSTLRPTNACQSLPVRAILGVAHAAVRRSGRARSMRSRRRLE